MADTKISGLTSLTGSGVDSSADVIVIVDTNVATTKKISRVQFFDISDADGGQIKFPATQNASSDANTLDDYEEGTFTPAATFGGAAVGMTFNTAVGKYTKIGNVCYFMLNLNWSAVGSSTGNAVITGLPFTAANVASVNVPCAVWVDGLATAQGMTEALVILNTTTIVPYKMVAASGSSTQLTHADFQANCSFVISGHYYV